MIELVAALSIVCFGFWAMWKNVQTPHEANKSQTGTQAQLMYSAGAKDTTTERDTH